jgi:putative nuclease YbcO-like protein
MSWNRTAPRVKQYLGTWSPEQDAGRATAAASGLVSAALAPARPILKVTDKSARIRESARGEECQVRLVGVCKGGTEHTIWSHARWGAQLGDAGRSGARKALDVCGAYACTACDAAYDGQKQVVGMKRHEIDLDWCLGHFRSLAILKQKGLL